MKFKWDYNMQNLMYTPRDRLFENVPLASPDPEKKNGETPVVQHLHIRRGALQKRQKAEVCDF
jgi:hypothetical protein